MLAPTSDPERQHSLGTAAVQLEPDNPGYSRDGCLHESPASCRDHSERHPPQRRFSGGLDPSERVKGSVVRNKTKFDITGRLSRRTGSGCWVIAGVGELLRTVACQETLSKARRVERRKVRCVDKKDDV